jgi:iron complex transport system ATP-binding protein
MSDAIELHGLRVSARERTLVGPLDLRVPAGKLTCLLGPNGSGKTSLLRAVTGLAEYEGSVKVGGVDVRDLDAGTRARQLAYVPQRSLLDAPLSVRSVVAQGRFSLDERSANDSEVQRALARVGAEALIDRAFPRLSLGEQRRVLLARALAGSARLLVLDEPDAYLDVRERLRLFSLLVALRDDGYTLLCAVHSLDAALRHADLCAILDHGRLVACDAPDKALTDEHLLRVFGVERTEGAGPRFTLPREGA